MEYRKLGKTDMNISTLSLGASSLGGVFHAIKEDEAIQTVYTAIDNGINFIDVSPYYGHLKAETVLGKALKNIGRQKYYLSSKVGRYGQDGINTWDYSAKRAKESVYESMTRLNVDYLDILNVHDIEFADLDLICNETIPALKELKDSGVVRYIGITNLTLRHLQYVIEHVDSGTIDNVLSFCHYCLNDDSLLDYLDFFEQNGVGVINASPFSMGLLTEKGAPDWHPAPQPLKDLCNKAALFCKSKNKRIEQLAIKYSVSNSRIPTTLFSTARPDAVIQNIKWAEESIDQDLLEEVQAILASRYRDTWLNS